MELEILPPEKRKTVDYVLQAGIRAVNRPVLWIMLAGYAPCVPVLYFVKNMGNVFGPILAAYTIVGPPLLGWIWWSTHISKWRIWALRTVDDWKMLESRAVKANLIWRRGSIFEKTECKSPEQRALESALLNARDHLG